MFCTCESAVVPASTLDVVFIVVAVVIIGLIDSVMFGTKVVQLEALLCVALRSAEGLDCKTRVVPAPDFVKVIGDIA